MSPASLWSPIFNIRVAAPETRFQVASRLFIRLEERRGSITPPRRHANEMLWFLSGIERMRLPVAAKNALSTAGAATKIVGSPTPPQKPPDGITIDSTRGISLMRIE